MAQMNGKKKGAGRPLRFKRYEAESRLEKNKARRLRRHLRAHSADTSAIAALKAIPRSFGGSPA